VYTKQQGICIRQFEQFFFFEAAPEKSGMRKTVKNRDKKYTTRGTVKFKCYKTEFMAVN